MKFLIKIFRQYIRNNWIAEGYEDERGFHFGKKPVDTEEKCDK
jgi:hypothetical protein